MRSQRYRRAYIFKEADFLSQGRKRRSNCVERSLENELKPVGYGRNRVLNGLTTKDYGSNQLKITEVGDLGLLI